MTTVSLHDLRRVVEATACLRGRAIADVSIRQDLRQLKLEMDDGSILLVGLEPDEGGKPRLEIDVIRHAEPDRHQLEVRFDTA